MLYRPEGLGATSAELTRSATCVGEDHQTAWPGPPSVLPQTRRTSTICHLLSLSSPCRPHSV